MFAFLFPNVNPIAFNIGPFPVRWYGISYAIGILLAWQYVLYLAKKYTPAWQKKVFDDFISWAIVGIILGGRLGYVLFYAPSHFIHHPLEAIMVWKGGMSFHGGLIGVMVAMILYCRKLRINVFAFADLIAAAAPIGLGLGRIANFINAEHFGRITNVPWGVIFPNGGPWPRHPSQLYEAFFEGFILWLIMTYGWHRTSLSAYPGRLTGLFLLGYGLIRFCIEFVREIDWAINLGFMYLTAGQLLSLPLIIAGIVFLKRKNA